MPKKIMIRLTNRAARMRKIQYRVVTERTNRVFVESVCGIGAKSQRDYTECETSRSLYIVVMSTD